MYLINRGYKYSFCCRTLYRTVNQDIKFHEISKFMRPPSLVKNFSSCTDNFKPTLSYNRCKDISRVSRLHFSSTCNLRGHSKRVDKEILNGMSKFEFREVADVIQARSQMGMLPSPSVFKNYLQEAAYLGHSDVILDLKEVAIEKVMCGMPFWLIVYISSCKWSGCIEDAFHVMLNAAKKSPTDKIEAPLEMLMDIVLLDFPTKSYLIEDLVQNCKHFADIKPHLSDKVLAIYWKALVTVEKWDEADGLLARERDSLLPQLGYIVNRMQVYGDQEKARVERALKKMIGMPEISVKHKGVLFQRLILQFCRQGELEKATAEIESARILGIFNELSHLHRMMHYFENSLSGDKYKEERCVLLNELERCSVQVKEDQQRRLKPLHEFLQDEIEKSK